MGEIVTKSECKHGACDADLNLKQRLILVGKDKII